MLNFGDVNHMCRHIDEMIKFEVNPKLTPPLGYAASFISLVSFWGDGWMGNEGDQPLVLIPIASMYGMFAYIWCIFMVNVGKYTRTWMIRDSEDPQVQETGCPKQNQWLTMQSGLTILPSLQCL